MARPAGAASDQIGGPAQVMQASPVDEGILVVADEGVEPWRVTEQEHLGENLGNKVYEADRLIIAQAARVSTLGKQQEQRLVQARESTSTQVIELPEDNDEVSLDRGSAGAQQLDGEAVESRSLARRQSPDCAPDLLVIKGRVQLKEIWEAPYPHTEGRQVCEDKKDNEDPTHPEAN